MVLLTDVDLRRHGSRCGAAQVAATQPSPRVLLVVHNAAAARLGDLIPLFQNPRIQLVAQSQAVSCAHATVQPTAGRERADEGVRL
ncbi:hypothetical protein [Spirillospora sp. CA-294931]|uniref:hypothetical protein n=1 Tax=Spirillospora sp. CA-294931 TaxID=3240042 RepID=UPI003D923CC2